MTSFPFDTVVFDLDGTLVDSAPDLAASLNHALAGLGRPALSLDEVESMVGRGARVLLQRALAATGEAGEALVAEGLALFLEYYAAHICEGTRVYGGVEAVLDILAGRGVKLALCTNKPERHTRLLMDALGWQGRFDAIVGADTVGARKPDPAPLHAAIERAGGGSAVMIGDSITDADTARAAGIPIVAVSFGFSDRPASELGADAVIADFADLVPALERMSGHSPVSS